MKIVANITKSFTIELRFYEVPSDENRLSLLYYGIIRAMKQHHEKAFMLAMDKFIPEELDEMMGDDDDGESKS